MIYRNATVYDENFQPQQLDILTDGDRITALYSQDGGQGGVNLAGYTVIPGMIDIHVHGCAGADTGDASPASLETMSTFLASHGVTTFCPTSMTLPYEKLDIIFCTVDSCRGKVSGAEICGVNMEGPYISMGKKGGQNPAFVRIPNVDEFLQLYKRCHGAVRLVDIAPEEPGGTEFIRQIAPLCTVSVAHTSADYDQACAAFAAGSRHVTHLYNAMAGLHHRNPGVVGATFDCADKYGLHAELICDGKHIHPAALRIACQTLGKDHTVIISDALSAAGTADGRMVSGGLEVEVRQGLAYLSDGTIAGSTTNLGDEFRNMLDYGVPLDQIIRSVTVNPARAIRMDSDLGTLTPGKRANMTVFDKEWRVAMTIVGGKPVYRRNGLDF